MPLVLVGSAPTALEQLLDQLEAGAPAPSLVIGMPVGFVGVPESKRRLASTAICSSTSEPGSGGSQHRHVQRLIQWHHLDRSTIEGQLVEIQTA